MDSVLASLFLAHSTGKLAQMGTMIGTCLDGLTDEQVWAREGTHENAVGNLVLHLCGNLDQWVGHTLGGAPDTRNRTAEFATTGGLTRNQLAAALQASIERAIGVVETLTPERLATPVTTQDGERTVLAVVYQVIGHLQQHAGQIVFATKRLTGRDLGLYRP